MKLIVTGATGFVGSEVVRLALRHPAITSVVALGRRPLSLASNIDTSKLRNVVLENWKAPYPDDVKAAIEGADACIWNLAVTPTSARSMDFALVTEICLDYTVNGIAEMAAVAKSPFRFVYTSGIATERDQRKKLELMGEMRLMRGRVENAVLDFAQNNPNVQVTVSKPGAIDGPGRGDAARKSAEAIATHVGRYTVVHVSELAAAMIDQCVNGITKDPLESEDLGEVGKRVLKAEDYLK